MKSRFLRVFGGIQTFFQRLANLPVNMPHEAQIRCGKRFHQCFPNQLRRTQLPFFCPFSQPIKLIACSCCRGSRRLMSSSSCSCSCSSESRSRDAVSAPKSTSSGVICKTLAICISTSIEGMERPRSMFER